jgi:hypothetical protein
MMMMSGTHSHMVSLCGQTLEALLQHVARGEMAADDALVLLHATRHCMASHLASVDAQLGHAVRRLASHASQSRTVAVDGIVMGHRRPSSPSPSCAGSSS